MRQRAFGLPQLLALVLAAHWLAVAQREVTAADALTQHYNNARTGAVLDETTLTTSNVNSAEIGRAHV